MTSSPEDAAPAARLAWALGLAAAAVGAGLLLALAASGVAGGFFDVSDVGLYHAYAAAIDAGRRPFLDFPAEYPPLALRLLAAPGHPAAAGDYARWFAGWMLLSLLAAGALVTAAAGRGARSRRPALVTACAFGLSLPLLGAIVANRFDALVALALAGFAWSAAARRWGWAGAALGLGAAVKLTPAVLLPLALLLAADRRARGRALLAFGAAALLPWLAEGAAAGPALLALVRFHGARPLQAESVLATPALLAHLAGLWEVHTGSAFGSQFVAAPGAGALARLSGPLALALLALVYGLAWRARARLRAAPGGAALAATAALLALLVPAKVLSPQYLVWLLPLAAWLAPHAPRLAGLLAGVLLLTHLEFPARYWRFVRLEPGPVGLVVARNLALAAALAWALVLLAREARAAPPSAQGSDAPPRG
ncbi:MAG: glycosyltransferase 87 family protein [Anaeromyxobacter sp.]